MWLSAFNNTFMSFHNKAVRRNIRLTNRAVIIHVCLFDEVSGDEMSVDDTSEQHGNERLLKTQERVEETKSKKWKETANEAY